MELVLILAGLLSIGAYSAARIYENYKLDVKQLKLNVQKTLASGSKVIYINSFIEITNPTASSLKIDELQAVLSFNDIPIGKIYINNLLISAKSKMLFPAEIKINSEVFLKTALLMEALSDLLNNQEIEVNIKGLAKAGLFKIPFNYNKVIEV